MDLFLAQVEDSQRLKSSKVKILGNGIGSGKTRVALAAFENLSKERFSNPLLSPSESLGTIADVLLVVGPAAPIYSSWVEEVRKTGINAFLYPLNVGREKRVAAYDKATRLKGRHIFLMSYEIMTRDVEVLRLFQRAVATVIVADEAHALKNYKSQRSKAWRKLVQGAVASWLITGTLGERPEHYFGVDQAMGQNTFGTRNEFLNKYCICNTIEIKTPTKQFDLKVPVGFKASAFPKIEEWTKKYVIRRPPDESKLPILLPQQERIIDFTQSKRAQYNKLKQNPEGDSRISNFFKLRALAAEAKLDDLVENLLPQLLEDRVTIIFTPFKTQARKIKERIEKELGIECAEFTGDTSHAKRNSYLKDLGEKYKVLVMTEAGKEGVDGFQKASALIFYDYPWSASDMRQIIGRVRRLGQEREDVLIIILHVIKSIDDKMKKLLEDKNFSLDFLLNLAEKHWKEIYAEL